MLTRLLAGFITAAGGGEAKVIPIGQQANGSVGTPTATGAATTAASGVSAAWAIGTPTAVGGSSIPATALPSGVSASASVGTPTATGAAIALPAGIQAISYIGQPAALAGGSAVAMPLGVSAASAVGTPVATGACVTYPLGLAGYWSVGTPLAVVPGAAVWPAVDDVLLGVMYGPTGVEYVGTATGGTGPTAADIAAAVRADLAVELSRLNKLAYLSAIDATLTVSQTSRTAGAVSQTISSSGGVTTVQTL